MTFPRPSSASRIYLDHNATTPLSFFKSDEISDLMNLWGNPSSIHQDSRGPKWILRETRKLFAEAIGCSPLELIFNSGASEGNNTVLKSVWEVIGVEKNEFIISAVEHPSVMKTAQYLESLGARVHLIPVSKSGQLDLDFLKHKISSRTALVSCMLANNETGAIFPIEEISKITRQHQVLFHVDAVQSLGKLRMNVNDLHIDYATFSAHKFYASKGTGVLFVRKGAPYVNLVHGGGQERSRRGGTENIFGLATLYKSLLQISELDFQIQKMTDLRNRLEKEILQKISKVTVTAQSANRLCNTSSFVIEGVDGETLLMSLDLKNISVSTGAACSSGSPEPSPVLLAMGLSRQEAQNSLRVSLGWGTTDEQVDQFIQILMDVVQRIRSAAEASDLKGVES